MLLNFDCVWHFALFPQLYVLERPHHHILSTAVDSIWHSRCQLIVFIRWLIIWKTAQLAWQTLFSYVQMAFIVSVALINLVWWVPSFIWCRRCLRWWQLESPSWLVKRSSLVFLFSGSYVRTEKFFLSRHRGSDRGRQRISLVLALHSILVAEILILHLSFLLLFILFFLILGEALLRQMVRRILPVLLILHYVVANFKSVLLATHVLQLFASIVFQLRIMSALRSRLT